MSKAQDQLPAWLAEAEALCAKRGARLTKQRRAVLRAICASERPLGAYDILAQLRAQTPRIAPPTVYRALDFLLTQGLIHKLETLHAYIGCHHPDHDHAGQFLICTECGEVEELDDANVTQSLGRAARANGFEPSRPVVELAGTCAGCGTDRGEDG